MRFAPSSAWTAGVAFSLCLILIIIIATISAKPSPDLLQRPSTFFTDPAGTRAIYLVLKEILPSVQQWRSPLTSLPQPTRTGIATLVVMKPQQPMTSSEALALDTWIGSGGQLILADEEGWGVAGSGDEQDFLKRHGIKTGPRRDDINAAVVTRIGRGRVISIADASVFSNRKLRESDNAVWLTQRCEEWGGGAAFDEYHLGFSAQRGLLSLLAMFAVTPWGLVCCQLALALAVYLLGCKRRLGAPIEEVPIDRTNPIETVQALGGVLAGARARSLSARNIHQYLNMYISAALGYRGDLLDEAFRHRLSAKVGIPLDDLNSYARIAKLASSMHNLTDADLLQLGRKAAAIAGSFSHGIVRTKRSVAVS